jgi:N-acetylmuramoyl-L-alanine amidase
MTMVRRLTVALLAAVALVACSSTPVEQSATTSSSLAPPTSTTTIPPPPTTTTTAPPTTTTTTAPPVVWPAIPTSGAVKAVVTSTGVVVPVVGPAEGGYVVQTPCALTATISAAGTTPLYGAHVVLDAGHGGDEPGAIGPNGLTEKALNLAVVLQVKDILERSGATVVLTRTSDYRVTLRTRGLIGTNLQPPVFVSIHHNAEPDGAWPGPGTETYYQIASASSKRLAGLIYEEVVAALAPEQVAWVADTDAGAKYRLTSSGGDYYGILSRTEGITAVLAELGFITNAPEAALLATTAYQETEAAAVARGIIRYISTQDPGSGYVTPYPRTAPAGSGGGTEGCVDPGL